jgi:hypothetical protein
MSCKGWSKKRYYPGIHLEGATQAMNNPVHRSGGTRFDHGIRITKRVANDLLLTPSDANLKHKNVVLYCF